MAIHSHKALLAQRILEKHFGLRAYGRKHPLHGSAFADDIAEVVMLPQPTSGFLHFPFGMFKLRQVSDGLDDADYLPLLVSNDPGIFHHRDNMSVSVPQGAFCRQHLADVEYAALREIGRALFAKAVVKFQQLASLMDTVIVACGTLSLELNHLREAGFLNVRHIYYTTPGLHEDPGELENQLLQRLQEAKEQAEKVVVVYGGKFCYVNAEVPTRTMRKLIEEQGPRVRRIHASHCVDMLSSEADREKIAQEMAGGEKVWWMTPGWIKFRHQVFKG